MTTLSDLIVQNGKALDQMARQFGLSQQQAQQAAEALLPAFSQGLKRNTSNPYDLGAFLSALSSGQHAKYFEDAANAFSPQGVEEGNGILGHLFGSRDLSRAVAAQASQATGISQDILKQMLPALASMIMGGLFNQSMQQAGAAGFSGKGNPLQEIIKQMMRQGSAPEAQPRQQAPQQQTDLDNPLGTILENMFGGGQPQPQQQTPQSPYGDNPLGKIFGEMLRGSQSRADAAPKQRTNPSGRARTPYDDLYGDMFEAGEETRSDYQKSVESIFDQFLKGMDRPRR